MSLKRIGGVQGIFRTGRMIRSAVSESSSHYQISIQRERRASYKMGDPTHLEKMGRELKCPIWYTNSQITQFVFIFLFYFFNLIFLLLQLKSSWHCSLAYMQSCFLQVNSILLIFCWFWISIPLLYSNLFMFPFSSCIVKSMKSGSDCPVCKVPYRRRGMMLLALYFQFESLSFFLI